MTQAVDGGQVARRAGTAQGITLAVAGFLPILAILSLAPALPAIIEHFRDVPNSGFIIPLLATTPGLVVALLSPMAGWIADRFGRRGPLLLAMSIYSFAGAAPFLFDNLWAILISRILVGASETFLLVINNALIADYFPDRGRRTWLTVQGFLGPALGAGTITLAGYLASLHWNAVFLIYLAAFPVFLATLLFCFEPERTERQPTAKVDVGQGFPWGLAAAYCTITIFSSIIYFVFIVQGGLAFHAIGVASAARIGAIMGPISLGVLLGSTLFNLMSRRWPGERLIATFLFLLGLGTAGMGFSDSVGVMAGFALVQQVGAGMTVTALIFWVSRLLPAAHRGRGFGLWTSAFFAAQFISPALVGTIASIGGGILAAFAIMGILSVIVAAALLVFGSRLPKPLNEPADH